MYIDNSIKNQQLFANRFTPQLNSRKFVNSLFSYFGNEAGNAVNLLQFNRCKLEQFPIVSDYIKCEQAAGEEPFFQELQLVGLSIFKQGTTYVSSTNEKGEKLIYLDDRDDWDNTLVYWRGEFRFVPPALIICNPNNGFAERFRKMFVLSNIEYVGVTHIGAEHA